jgi:tetratricopeptide (TPR) repeat protein/curved DNA-binding protein CbpA
MEANFAARFCCCWERYAVLRQFFPSISPVESAQMKSLYDLLGARENDDADALKKAFREAVKAHHPDLHPNDPPAVERFTEIIAANALLRNAKQRATYDWLLQREREYFQLGLKRSKLGRQQIRSKRSRTIAVIAAVSALIGGYELWATMPMTGNVEIDDDALAAAAGAVVEKQIAIVIAAARENENPPTAIAATKSDAVKGKWKGNVDDAGKPVGTTGAKVMASTDALDQGRPREKRDDTEVPNGANKSSADKHEDAKVLNEARKLRGALAIAPMVKNGIRYMASGNISAARLAFQPAAEAGDPVAAFALAETYDPLVLSKLNATGGIAADVGLAQIWYQKAKDLDSAAALKPSADAAATTRPVMQGLRDGRDAQATAGRELALRAPAADKPGGAEIPNGANMPSADKREDAKVLNEANLLSDDAAAIVRSVMQRLRDGRDAQAAAGRELALGPPAADKPRGVEIPNGAKIPSADKREDAKVLNEANMLSDEAAAIVRSVMQRLRAGGDAQATAGRELALGPPANDTGFYRERGIAAYGSGDFLGAIGNFDEAIRLNPNDAQSYNIRGNVWDELGVLERALADYDESIRIDPNNPVVFHDRAIMWRRNGELDKALIDLDWAIRFGFSDARMYCDRGLVWYETGHHDRAIADFDRAIKVDRNFAAAYINRGLLLHRNGEFNVAFADSKAIRIDPGIFDVNRRTNSHH